LGGTTKVNNVASRPRWDERLLCFSAAFTDEYLIRRAGDLSRISVRKGKMYEYIDKTAKIGGTGDGALPHSGWGEYASSAPP
jgi:hypothetical protein